MILVPLKKTDKRREPASVQTAEKIIHDGIEVQAIYNQGSAVSRLRLLRTV